MLREEMKKIWRPGMLIALILIGAVFYLMFLDFYIKHFPNGPNMQGEFDVAVQMVEQYGTTLEPEEFEAFKETLPRLMDEADDYIAANTIAQKHSLKSYADYQAFQDDIRFISGEMTPDEREQYSDAMLLQNYVWSGETNNIYGRLCATDFYIRQYETWQGESMKMQPAVVDEGYSQREYNRAMALTQGQDNAWHNILPYELPEETSSYFGYLLIWMVLSVCLLLSPVLVRDRMRNMRPLQWSARRGRGILKQQFAAAMLSAFLLSTVNLLIFGGLFATNGVGAFSGSRMFSFMLTGFCWVNVTYRSWVIVLIVISYLVCFGIAGMAFALSRFSGNYIAMLLKLIPLFVAAAILSPKLVLLAFYYRNPLYKWTQIPMIELIVTGVILLLGLGLCGASMIRQRKQDLLSA